MSAFKACYAGPRSHHHRKMSCGYDDDEEDTIYNHIPVTVVELSRRNVGLCNKREAGNGCCCSLINSRLPYHLTVI